MEYSESTRQFPPLFIKFWVGTTKLWPFKHFWWHVCPVLWLCSFTREIYIYIYLSGKLMNVRLWTNVPPKVFESSVLGGYSSEFNIIFFIRKHSFWIVEIRCLNSVLNSHSKVIWFEVKFLMVIEIYFQAWQTPEIWKYL